MYYYVEARLVPCGDGCPTFQGATYEQIQEWVRKKYGFHVSHLNIAQTKRKFGIIEKENYNLPKSEDSRSPETPKEKEEAMPCYRRLSRRTYSRRGGSKMTGRFRSIMLRTVTKPSFLKSSTMRYRRRYSIKSSDIITLKCWTDFLPLQITAIRSLKKQKDYTQPLWFKGVRI